MTLILPMTTSLLPTDDLMLVLGGAGDFRVHGAYDGIAWRNLNRAMPDSRIAQHKPSAAFHGGYAYVLLNSRYVYRTRDFKNYTYMGDATPLLSNILFGGIWHDGTKLVVIQATFDGTFDNIRAQSSTDGGASWTTYSQNAGIGGNTYFGGCETDSHYVVALEPSGANNGTIAIISKSDLNTISRRTLGSRSVNGQCIRNGGNIYIAGGSSGVIIIPQNNPISGTIADSSTLANITPYPLAGNANVTIVAGFNGSGRLAIYADNDAAFTSPTLATVPNIDLNAIEFLDIEALPNNEGFVCAGWNALNSSGFIAHSEDGFIWTNVTPAGAGTALTNANRVIANLLAT
jgi:hypothetical protein